MEFFKVMINDKDNAIKTTLMDHLGNVGEKLNKLIDPSNLTDNLKIS